MSAPAIDIDQMVERLVRDAAMKPSVAFRATDRAASVFVERRDRTVMISFMRDGERRSIHISPREAIALGEHLLEWATPEIDGESVAAMQLCFAWLFGVGHTSPVSKTLALILAQPEGDLFTFENAVASRAGKDRRLCVVPSESTRHLLATAVAEAEDSARFIYTHGWPILSVAGDTATVTEAGEASSLAGGGSGL